MSRPRKPTTPALAKVFEAALAAIGGLEGKVAKQDSGTGQIEATFDKKILGKTLGDRTHLDVAVSKDAEGKTVVSVDAYPLDAVGQEAAVRARVSLRRWFPGSSHTWNIAWPE